MLNWISANYDPRALFWAWAAIALSMIAIHLFERIFPAQKSQSYRSLGFNAGVTLAYLALVPIATFLPGYAVTAAVHAAHGPWFAFDLPAVVGHTEGWQRAALLALFAFVPILTFDFFYYWFHRLQHASPWLWEQHKLHHTDEAVNVTTSLRHHWTEEGFRSILIAVPMGILFNITPVEAGIVTMFTGQWGYLIHANIRLPLGPFSTVLLGPQAHRIHHSIEPQHKDRNFAAFFPIWDILFRTFYFPKRDEFPDTGIVDESSRPNAAQVLFSPFIVWWRMAQRQYQQRDVESQHSPMKPGNGVAQ
jgi:sterol desaturase/sphingolipid hydroxylase (fatty acid hydroxylase superfamily)